MADEPSSVFFPLRTSVELFADPAVPDAVTRAKEAAVLYDRVIFETGLLDATITPNGSWTSWVPPEQLTPEHLKRSRQPIQVGAPMTIAIGLQEAPDVPAKPEAMQVVLSGPVSVSYAAEFYTGILDQLAPLSVDWVALAPGADVSSSHPIGQLLNRMNFADFTDRALLRDRNSFERTFIYKSFNRDSAVAADVGAAFNITPLFEPMVSRRGVRAQHSGDTALSLIVPNLGRVSWEAVCEFREHPGSRAARERLREFETRAAEDAGDAYGFLRAVASETTSALMKAVEQQRPRFPEEMAKEAVKTAVSFIPVVGPVVEKTATFSQSALDALRRRRSWTAALMMLRSEASE